MTTIFLGMPPANIEAWIKAHAVPSNMTRFTFIDGTSQSYNVQTIDQQWLVQHGFCEILSPAEWVKTNQSDWVFYTQPEYVGDNNWQAEFMRGDPMGDMGPAWAEGDENATQLHFVDNEAIDVYAEKRSINWLKEIISIELGENVTIDESALEGLDLAPVYDGNGQRFQWICNPATFEGGTLYIRFNGDNGYLLYTTSDTTGNIGYISGSADDTTVTFPAEIDWAGNVDLVATRTENNIIGYTHRKTLFTLEGGTVETHNITGTLDQQWMIDNGYFDEGTSEWSKTITQADIGNTVTSIDDNTFQYCNGLTGVTIPDSVTSIGTSAFSNCSSLASVTIVANGGDATSVKQAMIVSGVDENITWNMPS